MNAGRPLNDASVITFSPPVVFTADLQPIKLIQNGGNGGVNDGTTVKILGWGQRTPNVDHIRNMHSDYLKSISSVIVTPNTAADTADLVQRVQDDQARDFATNQGSWLPTAMLQGWSGACEGDHGGPAIVETDEGWMQVGIVSWRLRDDMCASPLDITVLTDLADFSNEINAFCGGGCGTTHANSADVINQPSADTDPERCSPRELHDTLIPIVNDNNCVAGFCDCAPTIVNSINNHPECSDEVQLILCNLEIVKDAGACNWFLVSGGPCMECKELCHGGVFMDSPMTCHIREEYWCGSTHQCVDRCEEECPFYEVSDPSVLMCSAHTPYNCELQGKSYCPTTHECTDDCMEDCPYAPIKEMWTCSAPSVPACAIVGMKYCPFANRCVQDCAIGCPYQTQTNGDMCQDVGGTCAAGEYYCREKDECVDECYECEHAPVGVPAVFNMICQEPSMMSCAAMEMSWCPSLGTCVPNCCDYCPGLPVNSHPACKANHCHHFHKNYCPSTSGCVDDCEACPFYFHEKSDDGMCMSSMKCPEGYYHCPSSNGCVKDCHNCPHFTARDFHAIKCINARPDNCGPRGFFCPYDYTCHDNCATDCPVYTEGDGDKHICHKSGEDPIEPSVFHANPNVMMLWKDWDAEKEMMERMREMWQKRMAMRQKQQSMTVMFNNGGKEEIGHFLHEMGLDMGMGMDGGMGDMGDH
eukprot:TRINITY_DN113988_c0_g1_i1.p1 TRINITY_DN113988_c0_g1~~TRINITY_DN113988_c0_g1_i1.p1  ORF type:complete len:815 (+),score=102.94 TRINITY_DN113988_c0_g1_i1:351-2447(+)